MSYLEPHPQYNNTYIEILGALIIVIILGLASYCAKNADNQNAPVDGQHIMYRD